MLGIQGPFRDLGTVWRQRHKPLNPTLRVATEYNSEDIARYCFIRQSLTVGRLAVSTPGVYTAHTAGVYALQQEYTPSKTCFNVHSINSRCTDSWPVNCMFADLTYIVRCYSNSALCADVYSAVIHALDGWDGQGRTLGNSLRPVHCIMTYLPRYTHFILFTILLFPTKNLLYTCIIILLNFGLTLLLHHIYKCTFQQTEGEIFLVHWFSGDHNNPYVHRAVISYTM